MILRKSVLLNSHHDTVRPNKAYTQDPFEPIERWKNLRIRVMMQAMPGSLMATFLHFYGEKAQSQCRVAASAEEEISGVNGIELCSLSRSN